MKKRVLGMLACLTFLALNVPAAMAGDSGVRRGSGGGNSGGTGDPSPGDDL